MSNALTDKILQAAAAVAGGDMVKARSWFEHEHLPEFDGRTAAQVVDEGRGDDVLRLIESYGQGFLG
ncbi:MAG: DUF2384 domain-containing protein [Ramlibacter sp.]|nr:DUF2384 domain-containing protein [Ramlibacter sp.]